MDPCRIKTRAEAGISLAECVEVLVSGGLISEGAATPCGATYTSVGRVTLARPTPQARTRELRSAALPEPTIARFVKLRLSGPHLPANEDDQVALMAVNVLGEEIEESDKPTPALPKSEPSYSPYDDLAFVMYVDTEIADLVRTLAGKKKIAVAGLVVTQSNCSCGFGKQGNVGNVNGFPMMAALLDLQSYKIKCGGVIIDKRYVLTAAHCLGGQTPSTLAVAVGENDVNTPFNTSAAAFHRIEQFIIHPLYSSLNYDYDIALLRLNKSLEFSHRVGPVCLPFKFKNTTMPGPNLTILGWGTQDVSGGPTFNVLRKVYGHMIEQDACRVNVPSLTNTQFCTNTPGDDACQEGTLSRWSRLHLPVPYKTPPNTANNEVERRNEDRLNKVLLYPHYHREDWTVPKQWVTLKLLITSVEIACKEPSKNEEDEDEDFTDFSTQVIAYIAGNVVHVLIKEIKCDIFPGALISDSSNNYHKFISLKDKGGLIYPSMVML
ncbi:hypothetical protein evm_013788 [Chilo suppressalis]|nr:hypothetical protein evm_013788 [Chilo suppressalis]